MPAMTYLEMVKDILNDMESDPVTTIAETEESREVVQILKTTYFQIIDGRDWSHLYQLFQLTATGASTPTHMTIPSNVMDFEYIKYNSRTATDTKNKFVTIQYKEPKDFMDIVDSRDSSSTDIDEVSDTSGVPILVFNERAPTFWTSFDDATIVFDAYDSAVDTTNLVATKTQCRGKVYPTVTESDAFVFDLPIDAFSYFLSEAKSMCFLNVKQVANAKVEQQATTQRRRMSHEAHKVANGIKYPNYGRKGKKG